MRQLSVSDKGSIRRLQEELTRELDPLVLEAKLEEERCEAPALLEEIEEEPAAAPLLALFCSFGLLSRAAAMFDSLEVAALWDGLKITTLS